jgi:hypothetical protein
LALALAALSLLIGQSLRFDPLGWLRWGRAIGLGDGAFTTRDYPSWKPLPVLLTVPLAFTGSLAPLLLLIVERAAGFLALFLLFVLGRRRAGPIAGIVAAGALALTPEWWPVLAGGGIEPLLVALGCLAVDRHDADRPWQVLGLLFLVALGREEALALLIAYGAVVARRDARFTAVAVVATGVVAALWLGGDWIGSGDPLHGGALARAAPDAVALRQSGTPMLSALPTVVDLFHAPLWAAAAVGAVAAVMSGDRTLTGLVACGLGWVAIDLTLAADGYPLQARFLFPAVGALSLAAGVGTMVVLERLVPRRRGALAGAGSRSGRGP